MWKRNADSGIANRRAKELAVEIEKGMNENTRFAAIAHCVPRPTDFGMKPRTSPSRVSP